MPLVFNKNAIYTMTMKELYHIFHYCSVIFVRYPLGGVLIERRDGFGEHKPQIWSGPNPCYDKDGVLKFVSLMRGL